MAVIYCIGTLELAADMVCIILDYLMPYARLFFSSPFNVCYRAYSCVSVHSANFYRPSDMVQPKRIMIQYFRKSGRGEGGGGGMIDKASGQSIMSGGGGGCIQKYTNDLS